MGIKTTLRLQEAQRLFPGYHIERLQETHDGVVDTTYIAYSVQKRYILKRFERAATEQIAQEQALLKLLKRAKLNVPTLLDHNRSWYLYSLLEGSQPSAIGVGHIRALGRFISRMHSHLHAYPHTQRVLDPEVIDTALQTIKSKHYRCYRAFAYLRYHREPVDGTIHGDIFKDNTVFNGHKMGLIDFIDAGLGSFAFDAAVSLLSFSAPGRRKLFCNLFLKCYNQRRNVKLKREEIERALKVAADFYALKRLERGAPIREVNRFMRGSHAPRW